MSPEIRKKVVASLAQIVQQLNELPAELAANHALAGLLLEKSGFVDRGFYLENNQDVAKEGLGAGRHYAQFGFREGRPPSAVWLEIPIALVSPESVREEGGILQFLELLLARLLVNESGSSVRTHSRILRQGSYETWYDMPFHVQWSITDMCNYRCSYCNFQARRKQIGQSNFHSLRSMCAVVDKLARLNRPAYRFVLLGGEPTVYPDLIPLIGHIEARLEDRLKELIIVTNGSRSPRYFNELANIAPHAHTYVVVSIHTEQASIDHLRALIKDTDPAIEFSFLLMLHPEKLNVAEQIYRELCELRNERVFALNLQAIYGPPDYTRLDPRYPPFFNEWQNEHQQNFWSMAVSSPLQPLQAPAQIFQPFWEIEEHGARALYPGGDRSIYYQNGWLNFRNMYCVAGTHMAFIDSNGVMSGLSCPHAKKRINIFDEGQALDLELMELVQCPSSACVCSENDIVMKFEDRNEAENFLRIARARQERILLRER